MCFSMSSKENLNLCNSNLEEIGNITITPRSSLCSFPVNPPSPSQVHIVLLLASSRTLYKWNCHMYSFVRLLSLSIMFSGSSMFSHLPCSPMYFVPFYCRGVFYYMNIPHSFISCPLGGQLGASMFWL